VQSVLSEPGFYSLEEVRQLAALTPQSLTQQRDIAAVALLFLSGMRIGAFTSLPTRCVHLDTLEIHQLPELGVRTKNSKAAITYLLRLRELLNVVKQWDDYIRDRAGADALWYVPLALDESGPLGSGQSDSLNRGHLFRNGLKALCQAAGLPYRSPHKLRHGHAVYGVSHARDMAQLKAVSQNLMHSSVTITAGIYGNLAGDRVRAAIEALTPDASPGEPSAMNLDQLIQALTRLQQRPDLVTQLLVA
jgi:integrase